MKDKSVPESGTGFGLDGLTSAPEATFFGLRAGGSHHAGDIVLVGVPFDGLATERHGSSEAPAALRTWTRKAGSYSLSEGRLMNRRDSSSVDLGDVIINRFDPEENFENIRQCVQLISKRGAIPLLVGGDHSITYPSVTAVAESHPNLCLIQIDAHHDATDPAEWRCRYNHGTFVRNLIGDGVLSGERVCQIGIRDFQWGDSGAVFVRDQGVHVLSMQEIDQRGLASVDELLHRHSDEPTYVTFDIDSIDPAYAPGTGEHMVGGFGSRESLRLVKSIFSAGLNVVGADLVEVVPYLDASGRTCALASHLLALMLDGLQSQGGVNSS